MNRRRFQLLSLCLALVLLLCACGEGQAEPSQAPQTLPPAQPKPSAAVVPQTTQSPQEQTGFAYGLEWETVELEGSPEQLFYLEDRLLLSVALNQGGKGVYDVEKGAMLAEGTVQTVAVAPGSGCLWFCESAQGTITMHSISLPDGQETGSLELQEKGVPYSAAVDGEGNFYLLEQLQGQYLVAVYGSDGKQRARYELGQEQGIGLTCLRDGSVIMSSRDPQKGGAVKRVDTEGIGATMTDGGSVYRVYPGWEGEILLNDGGGLYALNPEDGSMSAVLDWIDSDVNPEELIALASDTPEQICLIAGSSAGVRLGRLNQTPAEPERKAELRIGLYTDGELVSAVNALAVETNLSQPENRIHVVNYQNYVDGAERIRQDVGELDLVIADAGAMDGLELTDLNTLFDQEVGQESITACVWSLLEQQEQVNALPMYFCVDTLAGAKSVLGEEPGWTPEELAKAAEQYPEAVVLRMRNAYDCVDLLMEAGNYVTDYASILKALRKMPVDEGALMERPANQTSDAVACLKNKTLLLEPVRICGFGDLRVWTAALGGELVYKGYPVNQGNGSLCVLDGPRICIPAGSSDAASAWSFAKALLKDAAAERYLEGEGFPVLSVQYEELERAAMSGLTFQNETGETSSTGGTMSLLGQLYETEPLSQHQAEEFRAFLDGLSGLRDTSETGELQQKAWSESVRNALKSVMEDGTAPEEAAQSIQKD